MIEKVNPCHPDKMADRIAGAIVDLAYKKDNNPKIAVEVLIGHNECNVIIETNIEIIKTEVMTIVERITKSNDIKLNLKQQSTLQEAIEPMLMMEPPFSFFCM